MFHCDEANWRPNVGGGACRTRRMESSARRHVKAAAVPKMMNVFPHGACPIRHRQATTLRWTEIVAANARPKSHVFSAAKVRAA